MKFGKAYRNSILLTVLVLMIFVTIAVFLTILFSKQTTNNLPRPAVFLAKLVALQGSYDYKKNVELVSESLKSEVPIRIYLFSETGEKLAGEGPGLMNRSWKDIKLPEQDFEAVTLTSFWNLVTPADASIVRLPGAPAQYLLVLPDDGASPPTIVLITIVLLVLSVVLGVVFAMGFIFNVIQKKVEQVDKTMTLLKSGDLKARVAIGKDGEISYALQRFNSMADEIESLVNRMQQTEKSRVLMLQDLAHDLRTPISSLKSLLEALQSSEGKLPEKVVLEIFDLCLSEVSYFQRLVEDLLILAQMSEPSYSFNMKSIEFESFLRGVAADVQTQFPQKKIFIAYRGPMQFSGDEHLLRRLFKNALLNALAFAQSNVNLTVSEKLGGILVRVDDDGCGFSSKQLAEFGQRKATRILDSQEGHRVSVGLGSVIMKTVVELHKGQITPENLIDQNEMVCGASLLIELPTS